MKKRLFSVFFLIINGISLPAQSVGNRNIPAAGDVLVGAAPVWEQNLADNASGLPFLQAESVVVVCEGGSIKSYGRRGTFLWTFDTRSSPVPYISRSPEGTTYVCTTSGSFTAVNRVGRELWRLNLGRPITAPVVVGWDGRVFISSGSVLACRTAAGFALWRQELGSAISVAPALDHAGGLVAGLENRDFLRVDAFGVIERLSLDRVPAFIVPLKSGDEHSYLVMYTSGEADRIVLDTGAPEGTRLSIAPLPALPGAPAAAAGLEDMAAVTLQDGRVLLLAGATGSVLWQGNSHETLEARGPGSLAPWEAAMHFDERGIFVLSVRGATGFTQDGRRRWLYRIKESATVPAFSDEGLLYVCGSGQDLRAYKIDAAPRNIPRSLYGPDPEGSYGMGNPPPSPWANDDLRFEDDHIKGMYERIDQATRTGQVGEQEAGFVAYLMEMTGGILNSANYSLVRPPVHVPQRIEFIRLLARMGSRETIPFLANLFYRDPDPSIKAACSEAIGRIGVDPKGDALRTFSVLLSPENVNRDPASLMSATSAIAALCRFSGPPLAIEGIRMLALFSRHPDPRVKQRAQSELNALRREGLDKAVE
ncbi:MAG: PQQ-binding-like beta-propeller repeat protein [Treponema sp.]|jgi:outer membrane protein assembly factor BamB|nr:PQQ-binding-like beta-propeller repeat protein [Treponema sp.]